MTTLASVFLPGWSVPDGQVVSIFAVATWPGPPAAPYYGLDPATVGSLPDYTTATAMGTVGSPGGGSPGSWEIDVINQDYYVCVAYSSTFYWQRFNAAMFNDGSGGGVGGTVSVEEIDGVSVGSGGKAVYGNSNTTADIAGVAEFSAGGAGMVPLSPFIDHVHGGLGHSLAYTSSGATRYVGATTVGHPGSPTSGAWAIGDFAVDHSGSMWVCTQITPTVQWTEIRSSAAVGATTGEIKPFAGLVPPTSGWLVCDGSAPADSRFAYADLFKALSINPLAVTDGNVTNGSAIVTSIPDTTGFVVGWGVSGANIPSSTTILSVDSSTQITLSANATGTASANPLTIDLDPSGTPITGTLNNSTNITSVTGANPMADGYQTGWGISGPGIPAGTKIVSVTATSILVDHMCSGTATVPLTVCPWGAGDGQLTFNVPDLRGRTLVGAGAVGTNAQPNVGLAVSAWSVTSGGNGVGEAMHALSTAELASHAHLAPSANYVTGYENQAHVHTVGAGGGFISQNNSGTAYTGAAPGVGANWYWSYTDAENANHNHTIVKDAFSTEPVGSGATHNNMSPFSGVNYIIKT